MIYNYISSWEGGREVYCIGFENRRSESYRGFESLLSQTFYNYLIIESGGIRTPDFIVRSHTL